MKVSTKGIYAIEAMTDLAIHSVDHVESIKNIAGRRNLSEKYLEQIIGALRRAKLIESTRGATGGYRLAKPADQITVMEILEATEKNLVPVECLTKDTDCGIDCEKCATRAMWNSLWEQMKLIPTKTTVADIIEESKKYTGTTEIEYYI